MDDKIEDIEIDLEAGVEPEIVNDVEGQDSDDVDLLDNSYLEDDKKPPPYIFLGILLLLIVFVFVKKFMASKVEYPQIKGVEKVIKNKVE